MSELAADGIPVAVSLRVLKLSRQPYYRWRHQQVTQAELIEAYRLFTDDGVEGAGASVPG